MTRSRFHSRGRAGGYPLAPEGVRIGVLSRDDTRTLQAWSGTSFHMASALERRGFDVVHLGPVRPWIERVLRRTSKLRRQIGLPAHSHDHSWRFARAASSIADGNVRSDPVDILFAPAASQLIAGLRTEIPIVYTSDATFELMLDYYPAFQGLSKRATLEGHRIERAALHRSALVALPTEWAARSATRVYGTPPERVVVAPYGANLARADDRRGEALTARSETCRLLWVGVDWVRKGGACALDVARHLRELGVAAHLTVVGCKPPGAVEAGHITVVPFLDKSTPEGRRELSRLYSESDVFLFPTVAEAYGVVLCEASAHGLPSVARATGGVSEVIRDGTNGILIPRDAGPEAYAREIAGLVSDPVRHTGLRASTRRDYEQRLCWEAWGDVIAPRILETLLRAGGQAA